MQHLTKSYLEGIHKLYTEKYLPRMETHAEVMYLKMDRPITAENVASNVGFAISDIENIDFDLFFTSARDTEKMEDWKHLFSEANWTNKRRCYSNDKESFLNNFKLPSYDVDELAVPPELLEVREYVMQTSVSRFFF